MNPTTDPTTDLLDLGDALEAAVAADLRHRPSRRRRRLALGAAVGVAAIGLSGAVAAATGVFTHDHVERGMPNGATMFQGTTPHCTEVEAGVVFDCEVPGGPDKRVERLDDDVARALADLPDDQRRAIELRVLHDQTYDAVAAAQGTAPATARVRVFRGLRTVRTSVKGTNR